MTDISASSTSNPPIPEIGPDLRLRAERPQITRLSRRVMVGLGAASALVISGALIYALQISNRSQSSQELHSTENRRTAEGLQDLPSDYSRVPQLGPALPGDLGNAVHRATERGQPMPAGPVITQPAVDPDEQRRLAEIEAARISRLFFQTDTRAPSIAQASGLPSPSAPGAALTVPNLTAGPQSQTDRQLAFLEAAPDRRTVSPDRLAEPASPYVVQAGSVIPAALLTGIRSDLPGLVTAQVTSHVYDSPTGSHLLIPQGSRLIGQYDSQIAFGQSRVLLVWNRLILPDGKSIVLERQVGADAQGFSGLEDEVDYHWGQLFRAAALSTLLGVATSIGRTENESDIARAIRESAQGNAADIGQQIVSRQLNVQPTITIRQGFPLRVIVNRDLVMEPYGGAR